MAVRKRRIPLDFRGAALADLALLDIATDQQTASQACSETLKIADLFQLTVYDAAYLELARPSNEPSRRRQPAPERVRECLPNNVASSLLAPVPQHGV
jgi:hypothetical protein